jgi:hypothetical protein
MRFSLKQFDRIFLSLFERGCIRLIGHSPVIVRSAAHLGGRGGSAERSDQAVGVQKRTLFCS